LAGKAKELASAAGADLVGTASMDRFEGALAWYPNKSGMTLVAPAEVRPPAAWRARCGIAAAP